MGSDFSTETMPQSTVQNASTYNHIVEDYCESKGIRMDDRRKFGRKSVRLGSKGPGTAARPGERLPGVAVSFEGKKI